jgi:peptidoglycan hydrolase-like protein with peptidoglycan-binding domain
MQVSGGFSPPKGSIYDNLDHNVFNGDTKGLLNFCISGTQYARGAPKSAVVRDIQQKLIDLDAQKYNTNGIDGQFGNGTANAVSAFQTDQGLTAKGIVDAATWEALFA